MNFVLAVTFKSLQKFAFGIGGRARSCPSLPVNFATNVILPDSGEDKTLNPIIYHHALTGSKELWCDVPQRIANATKRRAYVYDARNHGDTPWTETFSFESTVDDLRDFMESRHIKKAIVVGQNMGGWTASMFSLKYPHLVEYFVNVDMSLVDNVIKDTSVLTLEYIKLWAEGIKSAPLDLDAYDACVHAFIYLYAKFPYSQYLEDKKTLYNFKYPIKRTKDGYDVKHNMEAICNYLSRISIDTRREMEGIYKGPGYFMMAQNSTYQIGMDNPKIKRTFPNVELEIIPGVSHKIHLLYPDIFISKFLAYYDKHFTRTN